MTARAPGLRVVLLCAAAYTVLTALLAHEVLGALGTRAIHDEYDPLLIAAILQWNATHVPFTQAWWQFPIFWPPPMRWHSPSISSVSASSPHRSSG
jgi:hypothetical protein